MSGERAVQLCSTAPSSTGKAAEPSTHHYPSLHLLLLSRLLRRRLPPLIQLTQHSSQRGQQAGPVDGCLLHELVLQSRKAGRRDRTQWL
jgi:hypothetical protein